MALAFGTDISVYSYPRDRGTTAPALTRRKLGGEDRVATNGQIARELVSKGWEIRYRGGNTVCATPSDLNLIAADAPTATCSEGYPSRYSIATWYSVEDGSPEEQPDPIFDLHDAERSIAVRVRRVRPQSKRLSSSNATGCQSRRHEIPSFRKSCGGRPCGFGGL